MIKQKNLLLISLLIVMTVGLVVILSPVPNTIHAEADSVDTSWEATHQEISTGAPYAIRPAIAATQDGNTIIVVYSTKMAGDSSQTLYYSFSNANGESGSWKKNTRIYNNTSGEDATKAHVVFDQDNRAHVVWTEGLGIAYVKSISSNLNDGFGAVTIFPNAPALDPGAIAPKVVTYGNHVHLIWAEGDSSSAEPERKEQNIYHRHSTNGGTSWGTTYSTPNKVTYTAVRHTNPAVTVDESGHLHVLYEKRFAVGLTIREQITYAKGTLKNDVISWTDEADHVDITKDMTIGLPNFDVLEPDIIYTNGRLDASVTQRFDAALGKEKQQYVYHIGCADSCGTESNWIATRVSSTVLYVDVSPYSLASSIINVGNCLHISFDGKQGISSDYSEQIFMTSSCNNWGDNREELTVDDETRSIVPASTSQSNWWGYVVYEDFEGSANDENKQVFFVRNKPALYLPIILKK